MLVGDWSPEQVRQSSRKDSLNGKCNSTLGHTCHLDSTFLLWVNAPSSVDITGDIQPVFAYPAPLSSAPLTPPTCSNLGAPVTLLLLSVLTLHSFIEYLLNIYSVLGSVVGEEGGAQNTIGKVLHETYILKGGDTVHK